MSENARGGFFSVDGALNMHLYDLEKTAEAFEALVELKMLTPTQSELVVVRKALWSFTQLRDWKRYILTHSGRWPDGLISSDISERKNRLVYGVLEEEGEEVAAFFSSINLPCFLLVLEVGSIPVGAAG